MWRDEKEGEMRVNAMDKTKTHNNFITFQN